ncbi:ROK family protein [Methylocystis sp. IM3]|uniref:ROK family protein n=1 Tax=unclassified Methylocystis TaxID=2625913 RepID=UPI00311A7D74
MLIAFDIGGTKTRIGRADGADALASVDIFHTPPAYREGLGALVDAVKRIAGGTPRGVAVGAPGVLSRDKRRIVNAPNLPDWSGAALADDLESALGAAVIMENDTALVGLGEATVGAGRGAAIVAYVTISTGVNGARIVDGALDRAAFGFEIGEQLMGRDASARTLEALVSGRAIEDRFGAPPASLGEDHPVWEELAEIVAIGVHNTIAYWSPERIVLGGSMMGDVGIRLDRIEARLAAVKRKNPVLPELRRAALGDLGGLWGGLVRLRGPLD